jgi:hypothetical protein
MQMNKVRVRHEMNLPSGTERAQELNLPQSSERILQFGIRQQNFSRQKWLAQNSVIDELKRSGKLGKSV